MNGSTTTRSQQRRGTAKPWESTWMMPLLVADTAGLYFPEAFDAAEVDELALPEPPSAGELLDLAADYGVGWDGRDVGQVWVTPRLSDAWDLVVSADVSEQVAAMSDDTEASHEQKVSRAVMSELTAAGATVLSSVAQHGWVLDNTDRNGRAQVQPRMTLRRTDEHGSTRVLRLVLTEFARLWDPNATGPYRDDVPLPDADDAPGDYARELVRRLGRVVTLLNAQWGASSGATGAGLADEIRPRTWPKEAGPLPDLAHTRGQTVIEPTWGWRRRPSESEVDNATHVHAFDGRLAWLARAAMADLGVGEPVWLSDEDAEALLTKNLSERELAAAGFTGEDAASLRQRAERSRRGLLWQAGLWRVELPTWEHASLPAPHPLMRADEPVERWVTTDSLRLLREDCELQVPVLEAWVHPRQHRCLDAWAGRIKQALAGDTRAAEEANQKAQQASSETERTYWRHRARLLSAGARGLAEQQTDDPAEAATWDAVAGMCKSIYAVYLSRLGSGRTRRAASGYQHHHQATWPPTVNALGRRLDWIKVRDHSERGHYPLALVRNDEVHYLSSSPDPASVAPDEDTGALGKLRAKRDGLELTDERRRALARGTPVETLWEVAV